MFEGLQHFVQFMDIPLGWSGLILLGSIVTCLVPTSRKYKITQKTNRNGEKEYSVWEFRK